MKRRSPVFLARRGYRLRRIRDAARLLPVAGGFLFLLPILWGPSGNERRVTASDGIYIFMVWFGLIVAAALLSRPLREETDTAPAGGDGR